MSTRAICVRSRAGWCVASRQKTMTKDQREGLADMRTLCGMVVTMHSGVKERNVDHINCGECKARWKRRTDSAKKVGGGK